MDFFDEVDEALRLQNEQIYTLGARQAMVKTWKDVFILFIFPECVARFPFHSGGLGAEGVFARRCVCVRNRSQPSATVRVRTVWPCL